MPTTLSTWASCPGGLTCYALSGPVLREPPRDYLSDTPLACALWGFWCLNMANWVPPSLFSELFPLWEHAKWRCDTPPSKGVAQRYLRDTLWKQGKWVRYPPVRYYLERILRDMGSVSHWAAKVMQHGCASLPCRSFILLHAWVATLPRSQWKEGRGTQGRAVAGWLQWIFWRDCGAGAKHGRKWRSSCLCWKKQG